MSQNSVRVLDKPLVIPVDAEVDISRSRRAATALAEQIGFSDVVVCHIATSVSELAGNLIFHAAGERQIVLTQVARGDRLGMQVEATDEGPGIADIKQAMQDGFSTGGSIGGGLPGTQRLMDEFEISSQPGIGTRIISRKWIPCNWLH